MDSLNSSDGLDYGPAPEGRGEADAWLERLRPHAKLFIDGEWREPARPGVFEVFEPASGETIAQVAEAGGEDVDLAVRAARAALPAWQATSGYERAKLLYALGRAMQRNARLFAVIESIDNGKPIRESRDIDVPLAIRHFLHHAGWAQNLEREFPGHKGVGVVGQIIPWNFPLLMLAWKIAPALAAGCTMVLKPAEFTPLSAVLFAQICQRVGVPKGVINIVQGGAQTGEAMVAHPGIDKIAFTGSSEVGKLIRKATAGTGKKLSLELGGKSPFIVFDDADLDSAVEGLVDGIWFNQGQVCCAGSRLLVHEAVEERFLAKVKQRMNQLKLGDPLDKNTDVGAIIAPVQLARIKHLLGQGVAEGATAWQAECVLPERGLFFPPTLVTSLSPGNVLMQEEVFGPVLAEMSFRSLEEAVELANNTRYGLAASVWSENINVALGAAPQIKAGVVWINGTNMFDAACGFGGYRESGFGREGGREGMFEYLIPNANKTAPYRRMAVPVGADRGRGSAREAAIDRTPKLFIGGKQKRPDGNYSFPVFDADGRYVEEAGLGNRKDIRDAVSAARGAKAWQDASAHNRAQVLYFLAENLAARANEFAERLRLLTSGSAPVCHAEVAQAIERLFAYAGWADKFGGRVHNPPLRGVVLAMNEPVGVIGIVAPDQAPLLGLVSLIAPALAMGNSVVAVPSERCPLPATDLYQVFETSDLPAGAVNLVTGRSMELALVLACHEDVDGLWCVGERELCRRAEEESIGNLKRVWTNGGLAVDWSARDAEGEAWLRRAVEVKNIWIPYGD